MQRATSRTAFEVIRQRFEEEFGPETFENGKLVHWEINPDLLALILLKAERGTVVLPFWPGVDAEPYLTRRVDPPRPDKTGRSTSIASRSKSVGWLKALLYLDLWTHHDLDVAVRIVGIKAQAKTLPPIELTPNESASLDGLPIPNIFVKRFVYRRDQGRCANCGSNKNLHYDHDLPASRGGDWSVENVRLLCQKCNLKKSDRV